MIAAVRCLACGEQMRADEQTRGLMVCDECAHDAREDDHDVHIPNMESRAVDS